MTPEMFDLLAAPGNPVYNLRELEQFGIDYQSMEKAGLLKRINVSVIECPCGRIAALFKDECGVLKAECPECGIFVPMPEELAAWQADPAPLAEMLRRAFGLAAPQMLIRGKLWALGRIAAGGFARKAFFTAEWNCSANPVLQAMLPDDSTSILFTVSPETAAGKIPEERVFCIRDGFSFSGDLPEYDAEKVRGLFAAEKLCRSPEKKKMPRSAKTGANIIKIRDALRNYMFVEYSAMLSSEKMNSEYKFKPLMQTDLAKICNLTPVEVCRALKADIQAKYLFETAGNYPQLRAYASKINSL